MSTSKDSRRTTVESYQESGSEHSQEDMSLVEFDNLKQSTLFFMKSYFGVDITEMDQPPEKKTRSQWGLPNQYWFLYGIITVIEEVFNSSPLHPTRYSHIQSISAVFERDNEDIDNESIRSLIDDLYAFYVNPFKQNGSSRPSSRPSSNSSSSRPTSNVDSSHSDTQGTFVKAVAARDKYCSFCWTSEALQGAHIFRRALENLPRALPEWCNINDLYQVQNGLLLCPGCHDGFDRLRLYVGIVDEDYFLKVVKFTNSIDIENEKFQAWLGKNTDIRQVRIGRKETFSPLFNDREVGTAAGFRLYFQNTAPTTSYPNPKALLFHKAACLIWKMAGGAEPATLHRWDDDEDVVVESGERLSDKLTRWDLGSLEIWEM